MKITGWIFLILGILSSLGILLGGGNLGGPLFWIVLGAYLIHRANVKKKEQEDYKKWDND